MTAQMPDTPMNLDPSPALAGSDLLHLLAQRFSVGPKYLEAPGPTMAQWQCAAGLAERAPDHGGLQPFRFVVIDDDQRAVLAELFAQGARDRGQAPEDIDRARSRAYNGPGLAALVARVRDDVPDVPVNEQWMCVGAALMNFLNALHLMGFGAKSLSGLSVSDRAVASAFCAEGEQLSCWIVAGHASRRAHPRHDPRAQALLGSWRQAQG